MRACVYIFTGNCRPWWFVALLLGSNPLLQTANQVRLYCWFFPMDLFQAQAKNCNWDWNPVNWIKFKTFLPRHLEVLALGHIITFELATLQLATRTDAVAVSIDAIYYRLGAPCTICRALSDSTWLLVSSSTVFNSRFAASICGADQHWLQIPLHCTDCTTSSARLHWIALDWTRGPVRI